MAGQNKESKVEFLQADAKNGKESLMHTMFVFKELKQLNEYATMHYGFRRSKDGQYVFAHVRPNLIQFFTVVERGNNPADANKQKLGLRKVGYVQFLVDARHKNMHIKYVKVMNDFQGRGLGDELMEYAKLVASKLGLTQMTLDCLHTYTDGVTKVVDYKDPKSKAALKLLKQGNKPLVDVNLRFYKKHGFKRNFFKIPESNFLTPMILKNIVVKPGKTVGVNEIFNFKPRKEKTPHKYVIRRKGALKHTTSLVELSKAVSTKKLL